MRDIFCVNPGCVKPADGRVLLDDISGSIEHPGMCRDHVIAERVDLEDRYRSSRVTIAWQGCERCGGEGSNDGEVCGDCQAETDAGGPWRFGDWLHNGDEVAIYLAPGATPATVNAYPPSTYPWRGGTACLAATSSWDRCGQSWSPCEHPPTEGAAL